MRTDATEKKDIFKNPMWLNPMAIFYICFRVLYLFRVLTSTSI